MKITIAHFYKVAQYPPVISLIQNLLANGHRVALVSFETEVLGTEILENPSFQCVNLSMKEGKSLPARLTRRCTRVRKGRAAVENFMKDSDLLWTTTALTVRTLGKMMFRYRYVMQLMELMDFYPLFHGAKVLKFPLKQYARRAFKVVVPEINRAQIQKVMWNLPKTPYVLANKPYRVGQAEETPELAKALAFMEAEPRKIILYLGVISEKRALRAVAEAVHRRRDAYCLCIAGSILGPQNEKKMQDMLRDFKDTVYYLGYFKAPAHLELVKKASIGLLPYAPQHDSSGMSPLNSLYCAPNKIFEYAMYAVPMIGTDVMGLRYPFDRYGIGACYENDNTPSVLAAIDAVEADYEAMRIRSRQFYEETDLDAALAEILSGV